MNWRGIVAVILALGISGALLVTPFVAIFTGEAMSDKRSDNLAMLAAAVIGALAAYLAFRKDDE